MFRYSFKLNIWCLGGVGCGSLQSSFTLSNESFSFVCFGMSALCLFFQSGRRWLHTRHLCRFSLGSPAHLCWWWSKWCLSYRTDCFWMFCTMSCSTRGVCAWFFFFLLLLLLWAVLPRLSGEHDVPQRVLTNCRAVTRYRNKSAGGHGVCGPVWTKGIIWSISDSFKHTQADTHPAAAMCEACSASLSRPRVKVAACSLSIFSVKTWEQWIVSCLHQWTHSARVLTRDYELLSAERNAQLDLSQNAHFGCWPSATPKWSY